MSPVPIASSKNCWSEPLSTRPTQMSPCPLSQSYPSALPDGVQIAIKKNTHVPMSPVPSQLYTQLHLIRHSYRHQKKRQCPMSQCPEPGKRRFLLTERNKNTMSQCHRCPKQTNGDAPQGKHPQPCSKQTSNVAPERNTQHHVPAVPTVSNRQTLFLCGFSPFHPP